MSKLLSYPLHNKYRLLEAEYQTGIYIRRVIGVTTLQHQAEVVSEEELGTTEGAEAKAQVVLPAATPAGGTQAGGSAYVQFHALGHIPSASYTGSNSHIKVLVLPGLKTSLTTNGEMSLAEFSHGDIEEHGATGEHGNCAAVLGESRLGENVDTAHYTNSDFAVVLCLGGEGHHHSNGGKKDDNGFSHNLLLFNR